MFKIATNVVVVPLLLLVRIINIVMLNSFSVSKCQHIVHFCSEAEEVLCAESDKLGVRGFASLRN